ncbi:hypothetical protein FHT03_003342 [Xanthomonas arboricola]
MAKVVQCAAVSGRALAWQACHRYGLHRLFQAETKHCRQCIPNHCLKESLWAVERDAAAMDHGGSARRLHSGLVHLATRHTLQHAIA